MKSKNPSLLTIDSSKIDDYMRCPRYAFYRHYLGWRPTGLNIDLMFGAAIHVAFEHQLNGGSVDEAVQLFTTEFASLLGEYANDEEHRTKNTANGVEACYRFAALPKPGKVLFTEVSGEVLLTEDLSILFKMDAIVEDEGQVWVWDYKTTSILGNVWAQSWLLHFQPRAYIHGLCSVFSPERVGGCYIIGVGLRPKGVEMLPVRVEVPLHMMEEWLAHATGWASRYHTDCALAEMTEPDEKVMEAFPKVTNNCFKYNRMCPYYDLCLSWSNPLSRADHVPGGYVEEFWDPRTSKSNFVVSNGEIKPND